MAKRKRVEISFRRRKKERNLDNVIHHPKIGSKFYRSIRLANNLDVFLVNDPDGSMSAAAMAVRVGSFSDPMEVQGLSHLVEHLIHSGSQKFPGEREYYDFLSEHGGDDNGFTEMEHTIFHMEVGNDYLKAALDRFSQAFISPLLKISSIKSEINTVHSEFESYKEDDDHRLAQLKGSTSHEGHTFNRFAAGNQTSLQSLELEELHQRAVAFFQEHYRGGSMVLAVVGTEALDVLEKWVRKFFTGIREGPKLSSQLNLSELPIWNADSLYVLQAVGDIHLFEVSWMLPPKSDKYYIERPELYFVTLLGHGGGGSLYSLLSAKGWVSSLKASLGEDDYDSTSFGQLFIISMNLTNSGLDQKYRIVSYIYQYIKMLRDTTPKKWVMDEYYRIKKIEFEFLNVDGVGTQAENFAKLIAANMLDYPLTHVISGGFLDVPWNPEAIEDLMKLFIPTNMRMDLVSKSVNSTEFKVEPWYNSRYFEEKIPPQFIEEWKSTPTVHESLRLPLANKYIPSDDINIRGEDHPAIILVDNSCIKLWWKCEPGLSYVWFNIYLKDGPEVKNHVMAKLFISLLKNDLSEVMYLGKAAGLTTELWLGHDNKVKLKIRGYREKLSEYLSEIWVKFVTFHPVVDGFEIIKESLEREIKNKSTKLVDQSGQRLEEVFSYPYKNKISVLKSIEFLELTTFIDEFRSQIFVEGICHGDFSKEEAIKISNMFKGRILTPLPKKNLTDRTVSLLTRPKQIRHFEVKLKSETESLVKVYYQIPCDKRQEPGVIAMLDLFTSVVKDKLFYQLRTRENLGYEFECQTELRYGVGFVVYILSGYNPCHLYKRICKGMRKCGRWLENLSEESFESFKTGAIANLPDDSGVTMWEQINRKSYIPDFYTKEEDELEKIKKEDLIRWYKRYFRSSHSRSVAICIWGCNEDRIGVRRRMRMRKKKMQNMRMRMRKIRFTGMILRNR